MTITVESLKSSVPTPIKSCITPDLVDLLNNVAADQTTAELIRENFISYSGILNDGRYKTEDYLNAVKYVSYKLLKNTNQDAYIKTFPDRYAKLLANGTASKDIASFVSAYSKNKLVTKLLEQSLVPFWLLNQDLRQEALNVQVDLMRNANSEKVRSDAANSVLSHLEQPKEAIAPISIDLRESKGLNELREALTSLAQAQLSAISKGTSVHEIVTQDIMDVTPKD